jgi:fructoselysine-6-P-deglycase FrlB-like protein
MDAAQQMFSDAAAIQKSPITESQMRDAVECLQRLDVYRDAYSDAYSDLIAALSAQSGESPTSIRQVVKARADGSEQDLIDKLQGTLDLLTGGEEL